MGKIYPKQRYVTTSNCIFNFNILAVIVSEIIGGPKGSCAPWMPLRKTFDIRNEYLSMSISVFNFSFLDVVVSEIIWGQIYARGPCTLRTPLAEKFLYPKRVLYHI